MAHYRVVVAKTEGGVLAAAEKYGCTVLQPIREFEGIALLDDDSLGDVGGISVDQSGYVAIARTD